MMEKHEYLQDFSMDTPFDMAKTMAVYSAFTEGVQLFSSFAILLNYPRHNLMKGMGQIVTWSIRDESLHVEGLSKLFRTFMQEHPELWTDKLKYEIYCAAEKTVELEDNFIDICFDKAEVPDLSAKENITVRMYGPLDVGYKKTYVFENSERRQKEEPLEVQITMQNTESNGLGISLPGGKVEMYTYKKSSGLSFAVRSKKVCIIVKLLNEG